MQRGFGQLDLVLRERVRKAAPRRVQLDARTTGQLSSIDRELTRRGWLRARSLLTAIRDLATHDTARIVIDNAEAATKLREFCDEFVADPKPEIEHSDHRTPSRLVMLQIVRFAG